MVGQVRLREVLLALDQVGGKYANCRVEMVEERDLERRG